MPLSVFRGVRLPGEAWTRRDAALAQAAKMLDWSRCPGCGEPKWLAHNPKSLYKPKRVKCEACNARADLEQAAPLTENQHAEAHYYHAEHVGFAD